MIMLFFFLIPAFFGILGAIGRLLYMAIDTTITATGEAIDLHNSKNKNQKVIANVEPKLIGEKSIIAPDTNIKKSGKLMYVIVRRNEDGSWTQSKPIESYERAKEQLNKERSESKYPRLLKQIYV